MEDGSPYLQRIRDRFPHLEIKQARANQDGLINDILIINDELVFRFPRNDSWARRLLANEIKVIELASEHVEMPLPQIKYKADDLIVYSFIEGGALQQTDILKLNEDEQWHLTEQLATYLRQLHYVPISEVKQYEISQSDVNRSRDVWLKIFEDVKGELFPLMMPHAREFVIEHFAQIVADENFMNYELKLINGDTAPYHTLFDKKAKRINGIIDFGTAGIGDPAADFACIIYNYGESFLRRMARFYPEIEEGLDRARFWAGTFELQWALSGVRSQNKWWNLVHIGSAKDVLPFGSNWSN